MAKKFNMKGIIKDFSDTQQYIGIGMALGVRGLSTLTKNPWASAFITMIAPGIVTGMVVKSNVAASSARVAGLAYGVESLGLHILTKLFSDEKDTKRKKKLFQAIAFLNPAVADALGYVDESSDTEAVGGIDDMITPAPAPAIAPPPSRLVMADYMRK